MKKYTFLREKFFVFSLLAIFFSAHLISCQDNIEGQREYPRVKTLEVVNINNSGASFRGEVESMGNSPVDNYGFVWSKNQGRLTLEYGETISLGNYSGERAFEAEVQTLLEPNRDYYVKAYVKTDKHTIYGVEVSFISPVTEGPVIEDFEPKTANWGDTITIYGKNFWDSSSRKILFGSTPSKYTEFVIIENTFCFKAVVPDDLIDLNCNVSVGIGDKISVFEKDNFTLIPPAVITSISPKVASWDDVITIEGNFLKNYKHLVFFDNVQAETIELSESLHKVKVPKEARGILTISSRVKDFTATCKEKFQIQPPVIESISSYSAPSKARIKITGKGFDKWNTRVYFGESLAQIYTTDVNSVTVTIPEIKTSNVKFKVKVYDQEVESDQLFYVANPVIEDFFPKEVTFGDEITIVGKNFNYGYVLASMLGSGYFFDIGSLSETITITLSGAPSYESKVQVGVSQNGAYNNAFSEENIILKKPIITSISKTSGPSEGELIIYGDFFEPGTEYFNSQVYFGETRAEIISSSRNEIKVSIPNLPRAEHVISYHMSGYKIVADQKYNCISPWKKIESNGFGYSFIPYTFVYNNEVYVAGRNGNMIEIFKFDQSDYQWTKYKSFSMGDYAIVEQAIFYMQGKLYTLGGRKAGSYPNFNDYNNHLHSFDLETNEYKRLGDFPQYNIINARILQIDQDRIIVYYSFTRLQDGYKQQNRKGWEYNISNNQWKGMNEFDFNSFMGGYSIYTSSRAFVFEEECNFGAIYHTNVFEYIKENDRWTKLSPLNERIVKNSLCFSIDDNIFLFSENDEYFSSFWNYNINSDKWMKGTLPPSQIYRYYPISFSIGGKGYFGFGNSGSGNLNDFYEYDPTLEP